MSRQPMFQVTGNRIRDRDGNRVVLIGADTVYGRFAGGDSTGYGLQNYLGFRRALEQQVALGHTAIRLSVSKQALADLGTEFWAEMDTIIHVATDHHRLIVVVSPFFWQAAPDPNFLGQLAARYRDNPRVWLKQANEPDPQGTWPNWQTQTTAAVAAIRAAGNLEPIVLNGPGWSWDWRPYPTYKIADANLVLGAHRYANTQTTLVAADARAAFGDLTADYAVLVDEWGNWNGNAPPSPSWNRGFAAFLTGWIQEKGGSGALAFNWYWSDANTMTDEAGRLTSWGEDFESDLAQAKARA